MENQQKKFTDLEYKMGIGFIVSVFLVMFCFDKGHEFAKRSIHKAKNENKEISK